MTLKAVKFTKNSDKEFVSVLKNKVNQYFKSNNISRYGNGSMVFKSIFMLSIYLGPLVSLFVFDFQNIWIIIAHWVMMGFGMSGIGLSIMHDANHGSYSKNKNVNKLMSSMIYLVGGNALNWKIQHNVLHHTYTNIDGYDGDIHQGSLLRFSPHQPVLKHHKFQYIYAWFFYSLMTLSWSSDAEFRQIYEFKKMGLTDGHRKNFRTILIELTASKIFYFSYLIALPLIITSTPWYFMIIGFVVMHLIAGLILASIFQSAHVMPDTKYPVPDENGNIENNWFIHQLNTTANFAQKNKFLTWFVGGLNHQVEHHLFPSICHIHYPRISKIIKETALEFNIPYNSYPTFMNALKNHTLMLKQLGKA